MGRGATGARAVRARTFAEAHAAVRAQCPDSHLRRGRFRAKTTCAPFSSPPSRLGLAASRFGFYMVGLCCMRFCGEKFERIVGFLSRFSFFSFFILVFFTFAHRALADWLRASRKSSIYEIIFILVRCGGVVGGLGRVLKKPHFSARRSPSFSPRTAQQCRFSPSPARF